MGDPTYVQWVEPSCPANTAPAAYSITPAGITTVLLHRVEVRIPAGHQGLTGIALVDSGSFVVPYAEASAAWLIGDDDLLEYDYEKEIGANVNLATYNTDTVNAHAWQVRLIYTPMSVVGSEVASIAVIRTLKV